MLDKYRRPAQRGPGLASRQRTLRALNVKRPPPGAQRGPGLASRQRVSNRTRRSYGCVPAQRGPGLASRQRGLAGAWSLRPSAAAQRGPGLASRQREAKAQRKAVPRQGRSTRAGTRVPATAGPWTAQRPLLVLRAQRGPGLASRQRVPGSTASTASATALNEGRDSRPGNGRSGCSRHRGRPRPLNEGRDSRPGNGSAPRTSSRRWW